MPLNYKQMDLFGLPVSFNFNGSQRSTSKQGFICTILIAAFILWAVYNSGRVLVVRRNPSTITYSSFEQDPARIIINEDSFPIAFGLLTPVTQKYMNFIDESIYKIEVYQNVFKTNKFSNGTVTYERILLPLETEICTLDHFGKMQSLFSDIPLDKLYCIKKNQTLVDEITLQGVITSTLFNGFSIAVRVCQNSNTTVCADAAAIQSVLTGSWLHIHYPQLAVNPQNVTNPDLIFRQSYVTMLSPSTYKTSVMNLGHVTVSSDMGWLVEEEKVQKYVKMVGVTENMDINSNPLGYMLNMLVQLDQLTTKYERTYPKLQDVLAQIQGLATIAILTVVILMKPYSRLKFNESLINDIFDVKMIKKDYEDQRNSVQKAKRKRQSLIKANESSSSDFKVQVQELSQNVKFSRKKSDTMKRHTIATPRCLISNYTERTGLNHEVHRNETEKDERGAPKILDPTDFSKMKRSTVSYDINEQNGLGSSSERSVSFSKRDKDIKSKDKNVSPESKGPSQSEKNLKLKRNSKNKGLQQPNLNLAIEKPEQVKIQILSDGESDESLEFPEDLENISNFNKESYQENKYAKIIEQSGEENIHAVIKVPNLNNIQKAHQEQIFENLENNQVRANQEGSDEISEEIDSDTESLNSQMYEAKKIDITFWEYISSFVKKSDTLKEKMAVLNKGMKNIEERLDIFNIMKKFREIDKLKALLLEEDQLILFNCLPKPEVKSNEEEESTDKFTKVIKDSKFVNWERQDDQIETSYKNIKNKPKKSKVDFKLLAIYKSTFRTGKV